MASMYPPKKNTAFTLFFTLYKNDGTVIANPGTITKKVSIDGAAVADIAAAITEEDTTYGQCSVVFSAAEMNGDAIWYYIKDDTAGCVPVTGCFYTAGATLDDIHALLASLFSGTGAVSIKSLSVINDAGDAIVASSTGSNGRGIYASGNGTGAGAYVAGGATANGIKALGGATSGAGIRAEAGGGDGVGFVTAGYGAGAGFAAIGGATGNGISGTGGATSGRGILGVGTGNLAGVQGSGQGSGAGIRGYGGSGGPGIEAQGNGAFAGLLATGGATGEGIRAAGGATSGAGIAAAASGAGHGLTCNAVGGYNGLNAVAGATGHGIKGTGGATSGDGINLSTSAGHGLYAVTNGVDRCGIYAVGSGTGSGIRATGGSAGNGVKAAALGNNAGIAAVGSGTGPGLESRGGTTGHGVLAVGGSTSGDGIQASMGAGNDGNGILAVGAGTGKADINGDILGTVSGTDTKLGTPAGASIAADIAALSTSVAVGTPHYHYPASYNKTTGGTIVGAVEVLASHDDSNMTIPEVNAGTGIPGIDIDFTFGGLEDNHTPTVLSVAGYYQGSTSGHNVAIQAWNYLTSAWVTKATMQHRTTPFDYECALGSENVSAGAAKVRFLHSATNGSASHNLYLDMVRFAVVEATGTDSASIAAILSVVNDIDVETDNIDVNVEAIKAKTDNLPATPADEATLTTIGVKVLTNEDKVGYELTAAYDTTAEDVAALVLVTPANKLATDANGFVTYNNVIAQGGGADAVTLALGSLAAGAEVWLTTDEEGEEVIANSVAGDTGDVTFYLDAGTTYYRWAKKPGVNFTNPSAFVAVAD